MKTSPFLVYNASAGAGKTYTLVKEYLLACFAHNNQFQKILAITFTNKAAAEMKERVMKALKILAAHKDPQLAASLCELLQWSEDRLAAEAQEMLEAILHDYSNFNISTIDKFTHRLVRSFAMDLHLPLNFEVVLNSDQLSEELADALIAKTGQDEGLTQLLTRFTTDQAQEDSSWRARNKLVDKAKLLFREDAQEPLKRLKNIAPETFLDTYKALKKEIRNQEKAFNELREPWLEWLEQEQLSPDDFSRAKTSFMNSLLRLKVDQVFTKKKLNPFNNLLSGKASPFTKAKIKAWGEARVAQLEAEVLSRLDDYMKKMLAIAGKYEALKASSQSIFGLAMLNEMSKLLAQQKAQGQFLHISDFNKIIAENIQNQPAPFLYERLGEKFMHYFIDEFQDTSRQQWHNLQPLIENALAYPHGSAMLVGDGKQAIYRFRGGDVEQFLDLANPQALVPEWLHDVQRKRVENLPNNYRSRKHIVEFNNALYAHMAKTFDKEDYKQLYGQAQQGVKGEDGGLVQLAFLPKNEMVTRCLEVVQQCLDAGYQQKDIAFLTRSGSQGQEVGEALVHAGYRVTSPDSLKLVVSEDIRFLLACLMSLDQPEQARHRVHIMEYLKQKGRVQTQGLEDEKNWACEQALDFSLMLQSLGIQWQPDLLLQLPVYECLEACIRCFNLEAHANPYIELFLDVVWEYSRRNPASVSAFLSFWEKNGESYAVALPENINAIRVMTVHKSKGLEFPVVILPFAGYETKPDKSAFWVEHGLEEAADVPLMHYHFSNSVRYGSENMQADFEHRIQEMELDTKNLLYVATTRARDALFMLSEKPAKDPSGAVPALSKLLYEFALPKLESEVWEIGALPLPDKNNSPEGDSDIGFEPLQSSDWRPRLRMALRADRFWAEEDNESSRQFGNLVHEIFAAIDTADDLPDHLLQLKRQGILTPEEVNDLEKTLRPLVEHEKLEAFFKPSLKVWKEEGILSPDGSLFRPDRVAQQADGRLLVLDFKTGKPSPSHHEQLFMYRNKLESMGYTVAKAYLVYTQNLNIIES